MGIHVDPQPGWRGDRMKFTPMPTAIARETVSFKLTAPGIEAVDNAELKVGDLIRRTWATASNSGRSSPSRTGPASWKCRPSGTKYSPL